VGRKAIRPVPTARRAARRRKSVEARYARRWTGDLRADRPGDLVQFDTLTVRPAPGMTVKQFTACDPKSRFTVAQAFTRATSRAAGRFLGKVVDALPFPVRAIQVDGGSEFMAEFEKACKAREIVLCVLPRRSPKLNGGASSGSARTCPTTCPESTPESTASRNSATIAGPTGPCRGEPRRSIWRPSPNQGAPNLSVKPNPDTTSENDGTGLSTSGTDRDVSLSTRWIQTGDPRERRCRI